MIRTLISAVMVLIALPFFLTGLGALALACLIGGEPMKDALAEAFGGGRR